MPSTHTQNSGKEAVAVVIDLDRFRRAHNHAARCCEPGEVRHPAIEAAHFARAAARWRSLTWP